MAFNSLEELLAAEGTNLGTTGWQTITQEDVQRFADATRAHEWIHVDVPRAQRESPFGTTVVHGYLTLSLATLFVTELLDLSQDRFVGVNYGLDRVRFPAPVPVASRVRAHGELAHVSPHPDGARTVARLTYELEGGTSPPCIADVISLVLPTE